MLYHDPVLTGVIWNFIAANFFLIKILGELDLRTHCSLFCYVFEIIILGITLHDKLLTKNTLFVYHISSDGMCSLSCHVPENVLHCLRDYEVANMFWRKIVEPE